MFEGWLAGVLQEKLGKYLEISRSQLGLGLWNGSFELKDIELKGMALPEMPFIVSGGRLRRLEISIPWQTLKRKSAVVTVDDLLVVLASRGATTQAERDQEKERVIAEKRQILANEEALLGDLGDPGEEAKAAHPEETGSSFKERLLASILSNLVVQVNSVRVVYQDSLSVPGQTYGFGMTLHSLSFTSCTAEGSTTFTVVDTGSGEHRPVHKKLQFEGVKIFFDSTHTRTPHLKASAPEMAAQLKAHIIAGTGPEAFDVWSECVLGDFSGEIILSRHRRRGSRWPLTSVRMQLGALRMRLSTTAVKALKLFLGQLASKQEWAEFRQYRPVVRPGFQPTHWQEAWAQEDRASRKWWQYAIRGIIYQIRCSRSQDSQKAASDKWVDTARLILARRRYISLYKRRTKLKGREFAAELAELKGIANQEELDELQKFEDELQNQHILFFRAIAHAELVIEKKQTKALLRAYKVQKEKLLGGRRKRAQLKKSLSAEEYAAAKPMKPVWQEVSQEQQLEVYISLGLATNEGGEEETGYDVLAETAIDTPDAPASPWKHIPASHETRMSVQVAVKKVALTIAALPHEEAGIDRKDTAVRCALLRIEIVRLQLHRDVFSPVNSSSASTVSANNAVNVVSFSELDLKVGSIRILDDSTKVPVVLLAPKKALGEVDQLTVRSVSPTGIAVDGLQDITLQPIRVVFSPPMVRLLFAFKVSLLERGSTPSELPPTSCDRRDLLWLESRRLREAIRATMPNVNRTAQMRVVSGSTVYLFSTPDTSASPCLQFGFGEVTIVGAQPPAGFDHRTTDMVEEMDSCAMKGTSAEVRERDEGVPPNFASSNDRGMPQQSRPISQLLEYYLYKTVNIRFEPFDAWLSVANDPTERVRQSVDPSEKILHSAMLQLKVQVLRQPQQEFQGKLLMHSVPHKKFKFEFPVLPLRLYPVQLRSLYHLYVHMGYRFLKLKHSYTWNQPDRSAMVPMLTEPWLPWAIDEQQAEAELSQHIRDSAGMRRWPLKIASEFVFDEVQLTLRGYRRTSASAAPPLLFISLRNLNLQRMTNAIDESRLAVLAEEIHVYVNDELGDPDNQGVDTEWSSWDPANEGSSSFENHHEWAQGSLQCRHCLCSVWPQQSTTLERAKVLKGWLHADMSPSAMSITQAKLRLAHSNNYSNSADIVFSPQVEVSLPCASALSSTLEALLEAWHAVLFHEDLSSIPAVYEFPALVNLIVQVPRVIMAIHLDASSQGLNRDESPPLMALNICGLKYEKRRQSPCCTTIQQLLDFEELGVWDLMHSRNCFSSYTGGPSSGMWETSLDEGLCLVSVAMLSVDLSRCVDATAVYTRPFGAAPPYAWTQPAVSLSKTQEVSIGHLQVALTQNFMTQLLWYVGCFESVLGASAIVAPSPNSGRIVPTSFKLAILSVRVLLFPGPEISDTALVVDVPEIHGRGSTSLLEFKYSLSQVKLSSGNLDVDGGNGFGALRPVSSTAILDPVDVELVTEIVDGQAARRILRGSLPVLNLTLSPESAALLQLALAMLLENSLLLSRTDPEVGLPSKWDTDISMEAVWLCLSNGELSEHWLEIGLHRVTYTREKNVDVFAVDCVVATSALSDPIDPLSIGVLSEDKQDRPVAMRMSKTKCSCSTMDISIARNVNVYLTEELMSAQLRFYHKFWKEGHVLATSSAKQGLGAARLLLAECPRARLFVSTNVSIKEMEIELAEVAKVHIGQLCFSKTQPWSASTSEESLSPATVRKILSVESVHAWSLAGERPTPGLSTKLPCVLALIGDETERPYSDTLGSFRFGGVAKETFKSSPSQSQTDPALELHVDDTKPFWACPWIAQQSAAWANKGRVSAPVASLRQTMRVGTLYGSLQGEFLQSFVTFTDRVLNVFNETLRTHPAPAETEPIHSWATVPYAGFGDVARSMWTDVVEQRGNRILGVDIKVKLIHLAVPVGQQSDQAAKSSSSQQQSQSDEASRFEHTRERRALVVSVAGGGKGQFGGAWEHGVDVRVMSGTLHALKHQGSYVPHHELTLSSEQPLMSEPLSVRATVENRVADANDDWQPQQTTAGKPAQAYRRTAGGLTGPMTPHSYQADRAISNSREAKATERILCCDVAKVCVAVNESQYALVLASLDQLSALSALERHIYITPAEAYTPVAGPINPLTAEVRVEGVVFDLIYEQGGVRLSLLSVEVSPIFLLYREDVDLQLVISTVCATTQCPTLLHAKSTSGQRKSDPNSAFQWIRTGPVEPAAQVRPTHSDPTVGRRPRLASMRDYQNTAADPFRRGGSLNEQRFSEAWGVRGGDYFCSVIFLPQSAQTGGRRLDMQIGDSDITLLPEFARATVEFMVRVRRHHSLLMKSKEAIAMARAAAAAAPRKTDIVLTEDDVITKDLALAPNIRLFVKPSGSKKSVTLQGNGFSLRFEDDQEDSSEDDDVDMAKLEDVTKLEPFILVPSGVTLILIDMVLENFDKGRVNLGDNANIGGVIEMANIVEVPYNRSPFRLLRRRSQDAGSSRSIGGSSDGGDGRSDSSDPSKVVTDEASAEDGPGSPSSLALPGQAGGQGTPKGHVAASRPDASMHLTTQTIRVHVMDSVLVTDADNVANSTGITNAPPSDDGTVLRPTTESLPHSSSSEDMSSDEMSFGATSPGPPRSHKTAPLVFSNPHTHDMFGIDQQKDFMENATYHTLELCFQLAIHVEPSVDQKFTDASNLDGEQLWGTAGIHTRQVAVSATNRLSSSGVLIAKSEIMMPAGASIVISVSDNGNFWDGTSSYAWDVNVTSIALQLAFSSLQLAQLFSTNYRAALRADTAAPVLLLDPQQQRHAAQVRRTKRSIGMSCPMISLEIVDDSQQSWVSVLRCAASDIQAQTGIHGVGAEEEKTESMLAFQISADSMNNALMEWEPLIEQCQMSVEAEVYVTKLQDTILVSARDALNVNITRKMLVALQAAAQNWKLVTSGPRLKIANHQTAYEFRNDTLESIVVWLPSASPQQNSGALQSLRGKAMAALVPHRLDPNQHVTFNLTVARRAGQQTAKQQHASVRVDIDGYRSVDVDLDRVGVRTYHFHPSHRGVSTPRGSPRSIVPSNNGLDLLEPVSIKEACKMACNVSMYRRTKVASLRTSIYLNNNTDDYIQLSTQRDSVVEIPGEAVPDGLSALVHPGAGVSMLPGTSIVWIRPSAQYEWAKICIPTHSPESKRARGSAAGGGAVHHGDSAQSQVDQQIEAICRSKNSGAVCYAVGAVFASGTTTLRLTPTIAIHNRLSYPMKLRVYRYEDVQKPGYYGSAMKAKMLRADADALVWEGKLEHGASSLQCSSKTDHLLISVTMNGFAWSSVAIVSSPTFPIGKEMELVDATERTLSLGVDVSRSSEEGWHRSIAVFCSCWIINLTGLPLRYSRGASGTRTAANQPQDGNSSARPVMVSWPKLCFKIAASQDRGGLDGLDVDSDESREVRNVHAEEIVETDWGKQFSTTAIRTSGVVSLVECGDGNERERSSSGIKAEMSHHMKGRVKHQYDICVTIRLGTGKYRRTKVVRLEPQWMLHNRVATDIVYRQDGVGVTAAGKASKQLSARSSCPIWWTDRSMPSNLCFTLNTAAIGASVETAEQLQKDWSAPVAAANSNNTVIIVGGSITKYASRRTRRNSILASGMFQHIAGSTVEAPTEQLVRVDSQERGTTGAISVVVREYNSMTPGFLVENHTSFQVSVWQKDVEDARKLTVQPHQAEPYVWELPLEKHHVEVRLSCIDEANPETMTNEEAALAATQGTQPGRGLRLSVDFEEFAVYRPGKKFSSQNVMVAWEVRPRGPTKVLRLSARPIVSKEEHTLHHNSKASSNIVAVKSTTLTKALNRRKLDFLKVAMRAPEVVVALVDYRPSPLEVLCMCMRELSAEGELEIGQDMRLNLQVQLLQLDNSNVDSPYPVLLEPTHKELPLPFINIELVKSLVDPSVNSFPYVTVSIQEANLALDDVLLSSVAQFVTGVVNFGEAEGYDSSAASYAPKTSLAKSPSMNSLSSKDSSEDMHASLPRTPRRGHRRSASADSVDGDTWSSNARPKFGLGDADIARMMAGSLEFEEAGVLGVELHTNLRPVHCELLELHPVRVHITFSMMEAYEAGEEIDDASKAFKAFAGIVGVTLANIEEAPIKLNSLHMQNIFSTQKQLIDSIAAHYMREVALEVLKIIGTADLLGNPIGLLNNYATGVADFFYEPAKAFSQNPLQLGEGVVRGTGSLLKHSIGGSMNTVSKMTGVFGKGVAALSMDDDYLTRRQKSQRRARMKKDHLGHGMVAGVEGLGKGVLGGIAGIVASPMAEVHRQGYKKGMIAGVAKGIAGTVVKPTVGLLDLAEGVSTGLSNSAAELGGESTRPPSTRFRPPRVSEMARRENAFQEDGLMVPLTPYDRSLAYAFSLLDKQETYLHHARSVITERDSTTTAPLSPIGSMVSSLDSGNSLQREQREQLMNLRASVGTFSPKGGASPTHRTNRSRESFVMITDKRILVIRDVQAATAATAAADSDAQPLFLAVEDLKGLEMMDDGIELTLHRRGQDEEPSASQAEPSDGKAGAKAPTNSDGAGAAAAEVPVWLELPPSEVQEAFEELMAVMAQNR